MAGVQVIKQQHQHEGSDMPNLFDSYVNQELSAATAVQKSLNGDWERMNSYRLTVLYPECWRLYTVRNKIFHANPKAGPQGVSSTAPRRPRRPSYYTNMGMGRPDLSSSSDYGSESGDDSEDEDNEYNEINEPEQVVAGDDLSSMTANDLPQRTTAAAPSDVLIRMFDDLIDSCHRNIREHNHQMTDKALAAWENYQKIEWLATMQVGWGLSI